VARHTLDQIHEIHEIVARFTAAAIPAADWTHQTHLLVGAWHVARFGAEAALARLRDGIRALNAAHGTVDSDTRGYHETITRTYVRLLDDFLSARPPGEPLDESVAAMLAGPLAAREVLFRHYSRPVLFSTAARRGWVEPDLEPLP